MTGAFIILGITVLVGLILYLTRGKADTSADGPLMHDSPAPASSGDRERDAHYARWRQAILDTQILERKF